MTVWFLSIFRTLSARSHQRFFGFLHFLFHSLVMEKFILSVTLLLTMLSFSVAQQFQFSKGWTPGKRSGLPQPGPPIAVMPTGENALVDASLFTNTRLQMDTDELLGLWAILKPNIIDQNMGISVLPPSGIKGDFKSRMLARK
ncbi:uncharacterized protein LOC129590155 [Paramacrobiotus metropolitanus]|uniref:uncharacterized protein LOC129590155 n=1 Tax=Paramacrobiotus metropolitanus TaxID=2943436 RepID=UPI002445654F|nr:uncharacterized protein LOC129590155 [Paramacrobiotus metropolitanus]XP_055341185.1 uncharacterized protein LOC129590155 [Paramacrobiotus metropolitanus]